MSLSRSYNKIYYSWKSNKIFKIFTVYTNYAQCSAVASVLGVVCIFGAANWNEKPCDLAVVAVNCWCCRGLFVESRELAANLVGGFAVRKLGLSFSLYVHI